MSFGRVWTLSPRPSGMLPIQWLSGTDKFVNDRGRADFRLCTSTDGTVTAEINQKLR